MVGKRFDLALLTRQTDDPLPKWFFWRRIFRPPLRKDGSYIHGRTPLTVGRRFRALQAIQAKHPEKAVSIFYCIPTWCFLFGRFDKVNKLTYYVAKDLYAREQRDSLLQTPLTALQRQAGYDKLNAGLFGIIDYIATRNHLTYHQVEQLSDETLFAIMKIDHERAMVQRREMELQAQQFKNKRR